MFCPHIFVTHSLSLHNWAKTSREKFQTELNTATMFSQKESFLNKFHNYFDDLENCERRRQQANEVEKVFKNLLMDK